MGPAEGSRFATAIHLNVQATDNVGVTAYTFEYSLDRLTWYPIASGGSAGANWDVSGLASGIYQVRATVADAKTNAAILIQTYTVDHDAPPVPDGLRLTADQVALVVAWDPVACPDFDHYELYRSVAGGGLVLVLGDTTSTVYVDHNVDYGTSYSYQAVAVDDLGNKSQSSEGVSGEPLNDTLPPTIQTITPAHTTHIKGQPGLSATATDNIRVVSLTFQFAPAGTENWTLIGIDSTPQQTAGNTWRGAGTWDTTGLAEGDYTVKVTAVDYGGNAGSRTVTLVIDREAPAAPQTPNIENPRTGNTLLLAWAVNTEPDLAGYRVYRAIESGGSTVFVASTVAHSYRDATVDDGRPYYYVLTAVDQAGNESTDSGEATGVSTAETDLGLLAITLDPANPTLGQSGRIVADVRNGGPAAVAADVCLYDGDPALGGLIGSAPIHLLAGATGQVSVPWTPGVSGICLLAARLENVTVIDTDPSNDRVAKQVVVNIPPVAEAGADKEGDWNSPIEFSAAASHDSDGVVTAYLWDFGDGQESEHAITSHSYAVPGDYQVVLTVSDNRGASSQDTCQVNVRDTRADLVISNLAWSPVEPQERDEVTITATLTNVGKGPTLYGFFATFYIDGQYQGYCRANNLMGINESQQVSFNWTATKGLHTVKVVADDIQNNIVEINENNNDAEVALTLQQIYFPDLVIENLTCDIPQTTVSSELPLTATAAVRNEGTADAFDFWVSLYLDGDLVGRRHIGDVTVGNARTATFQFQPQDGVHVLRAVADDPVSLVVESNEGNNDGSLTLPSLTLAYPDLVVSGITILPQETTLSDGTSLDISATVENRGAVAVERRFKASFYVDGSYIGARDIVSLAAGGAQTVALQTRATPGRHSARVVVDEDEAVRESNEGNNAATQDTPELTILYPDLIVSNVVWMPQNATYNQEVVFACTVANTTVVSTLENCLFSLYVDDIQVASQELPRIRGHSSQSFSLGWTARVDPKVPHSIKAVVDVRHNIHEENEENNEWVVAAGTFHVADSFAVQVDALGAGLDEMGMLIYTSRQVAEFVATITRGSTGNTPCTPASGVEGLITVIKRGAWYVDEQGQVQQRPDTVVFQDQPMTFRPVDSTFRCSIDLLTYGMGTYSVRVVGTDGVDSAGKFLSMTVIEECNFTLATDKAVYLRQEPVHITGNVTTLSGQPLAMTQVAIMVGKAGEDSLLSQFFDQTTRKFKTDTDMEGNVDFTFYPLWGDAGHFSVDAFVTARLMGTSGHAEFAILAADITPTRLSVTTTKNRTYTRTFTLTNVSEDPLTNPRVTLIDADTQDNITGTLSLSLPGVLGAGSRVPITLNVTIPEDAPDSAAFRILLNSDEGVTAEAQVSFTLRPAAPLPKLEPNLVKVGMNPGTRLVRTVTLRNDGLGTMRNITLVSPAAIPWVTVGGLEATDLAPGASTTFEIMIEPSESIQLGIYADKILATDGVSSAEMILSVEVNSANRGGVSFVLTNDAGQMVKDAEIALTSQEVFTAVYGAQTSTYRNTYHAKSDQRGIATLEDVPIGDYDYTVAAAGHETVQGTVAVMPQSEAQVVPITLVALPLSIKWTVTPMVIEDTYDITLTLSYSVEIPKPQLVFLPPWVCVPHELQSDITDQVMIVNPSLIELRDVKATVVGAPGITLSSGGQIGTMAAQSSAVLGYRIPPGNYDYLDGINTYIVVTATYVRFDPLTLEPLEDQIEGRIPLVNPGLSKVTVEWPGGGDVELQFPEGGDEIEFNLPPLGGGGGGGGTATEVVKLVIPQTATLEREGFDARLEMTNGLDKELVGVSVSPRVTDADGVDVTDRFYVVPPEMTGITAVDGSDSLDGYSTMTGRWVLIPGEGLGGTELEGKPYWVKAVISYYVDGHRKETQTESIQITVHPQPKLYLHYYVPKEVLADEPFKLGLLVENEGDGEAKNLKIDSGQPTIVDNQSGLLIHFAIVGSSFGSVTGDIVRLVLGDVAPHSTANGYWIMTCSLDGQCVGFSAELTHRAYKGVDINPLIVEATTEIIEHDHLFADAVDPDNCFTLIDRNKDGFPDYLINLTSGLRLPIIIPQNVNVLKSPTPLDRTMELEVPETAGYVCVIMPDPMPEANIRSIKRAGADGKPDTLLNGNNFWKANGNIYFVDELGYVDESGVRQPQSAMYTLDFRSALAVKQVDCAPTEFSIIYSEEGMAALKAGVGDVSSVEINEPVGDSWLTTYELKTPIFPLPVPPTEGQKAAIRVIVRNDGVIPENGTLDIYDVAPGGAETLINSLTLDSLRAYCRKEFIVQWTPQIPGEHQIEARLRNDSPDKEMVLAVHVNRKPYADAGADFFSDVKKAAKFDGTRSLDEDGYIRVFFWDFGDDVWGGGMGPTHVYQNSGTYKVHVIVKDDVGAMTEDVMQVTINETRADLIVDSITISPQTPQEDEEVTLTAAVKNIGASASPAGSFYAGFYVDGQYQSVQKFTDAVQPGDSVSIPFRWHATLGNHLFTFVADDMMNEVDEADEGNNSRTVALYPDQVYFPDLVVEGVALSVTPDQPVPWGTPVSIVARVKNTGTAVAGRFRVDFDIDGKDSGYTTVDQLGIGEGLDAVQASIPWLPTAGKHAVLVRVDYPLSHIVELNEHNNAFTGELPSLHIVYPDLVATDLQIWPPDGKVNAGQPCFAWGTVRNNSGITIPSLIPVSLRTGGEVVTTGEIDGLRPGEEKSVELTWLPRAGSQTIQFIADAPNVVPESNEENNSRSLENFGIDILHPDLVISDISVIGQLRLGEDIVISVRFANPGAGDVLQPFNVRLFVNGQLVDVKRVSGNLLAGSYDRWFKTWTVQSSDPTHCVVAATVDANDEIAERDEGNNSLSRQFQIDPSYILALDSAQPVYLTSQAIGLSLTVQDSVNRTPLGPTDQIAAVLRIRDSGGNLVMEMTPSWVSEHSRFESIVSAGALPAGSYTAEAEIHGPLQTQCVSVGFSVAEEFGVTVDTDRDSYALGQNAVISGAAAGTDGVGIGNVRVEIDVNHSGTSRCYDVVTQPDGTFSYTFVPTGFEGGAYHVEVSATVNSLTKASYADFTIEGIVLELSSRVVTMSAGSSDDVVLGLTNVGTRLRTDVTIAIEAMTPSADIVVTVGSAGLPTEIGPGNKSEVHLGVNAGTFVGEAKFKIAVRSGSGVDVLESVTWLTVVTQPAVPQYLVEPSELKVGVIPGGTVDRQITITNIGYADMTALSVSMPSLPWIHLISSSQTVLKHGEHAWVLVRVSPGESVEFGVYSDALVISSNAGQCSVPIRIEVAAPSADICVSAMDTMGFDVSEATVLLSLENTIYADVVDSATLSRCKALAGVTDEHGQVEFDRLVPGLYKYTVSARYHEEKIGTCEVEPRLSLQDLIIDQVKFNPMELSLTPKPSTDPVNLGQVQLGLVLDTGPKALLTDRPGAEYLILRSGQLLSNRLAYLDLGGRFSKENQSFSLNNTTATDIESVRITPCGDVAPYIHLPSLSVDKVPAGGSVILSYQVDASGLPLNADRTVDGYLLISPSGRDAIEFPIRIRVAAAEDQDDGKPYNYVPFSGPWPTGPIMYGEGFINTWLKGAHYQGASATGQSLGAVQLSQRVAMEGEAFEVSLTLANLLDRKSIDNLSYRLVITDPSGSVVPQDFFEIVSVATAANELAPLADTTGVWQVKPMYGKNVGGTNPAGVAYKISIELSYQIEGRAGQGVVGPQDITVKPEPRFVLRYVVKPVGGSLNLVRIEVTVDNTGYGAAKRLEIAFPKIEMEGAAFTVLGNQTVILGDIGPNQTGTGTWLLEFKQAPDIAAVASSLGPSSLLCSEEGQTSTLAGHLEYQFTSREDIASIESALRELLAVSKTKVERELNTLAQAYDTLHILLRESKALIGEEVAVSLYNALGGMLIDFAGLMLSVQAIDEGVLSDLSLTGNRLMLEMSLGDYVSGTLGLGTDMLNAAANALNARSSLSDLEILMQQLGLMMGQKDTSLQEWLDYLKKNNSYRNVKTYLIWDELGHYQTTPSQEEIIRILDDVLGKGGEGAKGIDDLFHELDGIVDDTVYLLSTVKSNALFPVDILCQEIQGLTQIIATTGTGIGQSEENRALLHPYWYCVGEKNDWYPVFRNTWEFGTIFEHWLHMQQWESMQWGNFSLHWDIISQMYVASLMLNSASSLGLTMGSFGGAFWGVGMSAAWDAINETYQSALASMRQTEKMTYKLIVQEAVKFMEDHTYEADGLWRMFSDIENHVDYIIEHNPIDPEVAINVESLDFKNLGVDENQLFGAGPAAVVVTNSCNLNLHVQPSVTVRANGTGLVTYEGQELSLAPGETGTSGVLLVLPRSSLYDNTGYDVEVNLDAWDPVTLSRKQFGPFYSHFYVGTQEELAYFGQQTVSQPLGGPAQTGETYTRAITVTSGTARLRIGLIYSQDADLDLNLYDEAGNHVGFSDVLGRDELGIPDSQYTGSDSTLQMIELDPAGSPTYRLEVVCKAATPDSQFAVWMIEIPDYPALLETSTESVTLASKETQIDFDLSALEWGDCTGVTNLDALLGPLVDGQGNPLALASAEIQPASNTLAPGTSADITVRLALDGGAADGTYSGLLTVTGQDAETGADLTQVVRVVIHLDRQAPAAPQITVTPNPADVMPISVTGSCEPSATVELYVDDYYAMDATADQEGKFDFSGLLLGMGEHSIKARALDAAGNASDYSVSVVVTSTVDPFAPVTEAVPTGDKGDNEWYRSNVSVTLDAQDSGGSGVARTQVAVADGPWSDYAGPVAIGTEGAVKISFKSTDNAGNEEVVKIAYLKIDKTTPSSAVAPLPQVVSDPTFTVIWSGADDPEGSGLASYDVYVSTDASPCELWLAKTVESSAIFSGERGHAYAFYSCAHDSAGNVEAAPGLPDAMTEIPVPNVPPVVDAGPDATVNEGEPFTRSGSFTDSDTGDSWRGTVDYGEGAGPQTLTLNPDKTFDLSHTYVENGTYTLTVTVTDSYNESDSDLVQVTVLNVAPIIDAGPDQTIERGQVFDLQGTFSDAGLVDTHTGAIGWGDGTSESGVVDQAGRTISGSHLYARRGTYRVTVTAIDDDGASGSDTLDVTVKNTPPQAIDDTYSTNEDQACTVPALGVLLNDTDADSDPLTAIKVTDPAHGQLVVNTNGSFIYTPQADYFGADCFTYKATDGLDESNVATVSITVNPVNDAPTLTAVQTLIGAYKDHQFSITYDILAAAANEADVDGDTVQFRIEAISSGTKTLTKGGVDVKPGTAEALLGPGESWLWNPATGKTGILNAFTVKAWDGSLASAVPVMVKVQVDAVPDLQPTAVDSSVWQSAEPGTTVDWTATVKNNGVGPQWADWTVQWYLSTDNVFQTSDTLVGSATYSDDIAAGASVSKTFSAAVPSVSSAGQAYVIAYVVNAGPETRTDNNVKVSSDRDWFGEVSPDPDEANNTSGSAKDLTYVAGTCVWDGRTLDSQGDVDWYKFTTVGTATSDRKVQIDFSNVEGDLALGVYLTDGTAIKEMDGTGNSEQVSLSGLAEGTYYVQVWSNHGDVSRNYKLTIVAPPRPDLQPTAVDSSVWQSAEPGAIVDWTVTVKNNGPGLQEADWTVEWYLSTDSVFQTSDTLIGSATYSDDLASGASVSKTYNVAVPVVPAAGQQYLIARVVGAWPETRIDNNVKVSSDRDWFGEVSPDADETNNSRETAKDLTYVAGTCVWDGRTLDSQGDVDWYKFTTVGTAGSDRKVQIDFSNVEGDLALGVYRADGSAIQEPDGTGNSEQVSLSGLAEGTYYVQVWSNHGDVSRNYKLTILAPPRPDLQPTAADSSVWQSAEPGAMVDWTVTVKNNGPGLQEADWTVQWYLSTDNTFQTTDTLIGSATYSDDLASGASVSKTYSAAVPSVPSAGQQYVIARVVNAGPESKTDNNTKVSTDTDWFGLVAPDPDEDNDTFDTAFNLGSFTGTQTRSGRTIDSADDVDWYRFTTQRTGTSSQKVRIDFTNAEGDLALALYGSDGALIQQVDTTGNAEEIKLTGLLQGTYYLKVLSNHKDVSRGYKLTILA